MLLEISCTGSILKKSNWQQKKSCKNYPACKELTESQEKKHRQIERLFSQLHLEGAQRLSCRVLDSRSRGCLFKSHWCHCVVSLSKTHLIYCLLSTGSTHEDRSWHNWKIVDWDVKNQIKQNLHANHFLDFQHTSKHFSGTVPDRNYKEWFITSDIFQNVRETIQDVAVPSPLVEEQEGILTVSMESSIEEMFQLAPSTLTGTMVLLYKPCKHI